MRTLRTCRAHLWSIAAFSAVFNILALTPTIYMMQVYDRVLASGSLVTLLALSLFCLLGLAALAALDWLRSRLLVRLTARFDHELAGETMESLLSRPGLSRLERAEGMRLFDTLRTGLGGPGIVALFDLPWSPVFLLVAFLVHPAIGALTIVGGLLLLGVAWLNERSTHGRLRTADEAAAVAYGNQGHIVSYANEIRAMGMGRQMIARNLRERRDMIRLQVGASLTASGYTALARFLRMLLQSAALGLGACLAVRGDITPGAVFASGLLFARAVAPIEAVIGGLKHLGATYDAYRKINALLIERPLASRTRLPDPQGYVSVEGLTVETPSNDRIALVGVTFSAAPGDCIGVVGPSGAGKSTLLRALAGTMAPKAGTVRFDGAAFEDWEPDQIARAIGYLPQDFVLFPGSVKDNIARFDTEFGGSPALDARVVEAARVSGAHDTILQLPQGYETRVGPGGTGLSSGQAQRIALARALYGSPRYLLLDEPNAHLDKGAQAHLIGLLERLRSRGVTIIMAAHNPNVLAVTNRLLLIEQGRLAHAADGPAARAPVPASALQEA